VIAAGYRGWRAWQLLDHLADFRSFPGKKLAGIGNEDANRRGIPSRGTSLKGGHAILAEKGGGKRGRGIPREALKTATDSRM